MDESENKPKEKKPANWNLIFTIISVFLIGLTIYYQFFHKIHRLSANITIVSVMPDSTYVEVVLFNNGNCDEFIKYAGFEFQAHTKPHPVWDTKWMKNTLIKKGERKMFELKYQTWNNSPFSKNNARNSGVASIDSCNIDVFFFVKIMNKKNIEDIVRVKISHVDSEYNITDYTPILFDFRKKKSKRLNDKPKKIKI